MSTLTALLQHKVKKSSKKPLHWLRKATLTERPLLHGAFGERDAFPCDFLRSGGTLKLVDKYLHENVEPSLERDSEGSVLPKKRLVDMREEARRFIHGATHCSEQHVVLFTEPDFVFAFEAYLQSLDVPRLSAQGRRPPVVLIGQDLYGTLHGEVHRCGAEALEIRIGQDSRYDLKKMEALLKFYKKQERNMLGVFAVGDEMTGMLHDTQQITALLHSHGALSLWDYSSAGAYTKIDMCPLVSYGGLTYKDAAFVRADRFLGGEGASGVFITKAQVLTNPMFETVLEGILSTHCVEGSIEVDLSPHSTNDPVLTRERRRKLVCGPIRARSAFELKAYFGDAYIQKRTLEITEHLAQSFAQHDALHVAGRDLEHMSLPYLSLFFFHPNTEWALHHGFVVAVLQDLFGIGALTHTAAIQHLPETPLLESQRAMHSILSRDGSDDFMSEKVMQVGTVHLSLMYFVKDTDLDFVTSAILLTAEQGWRLLPFYRYNVGTGKWIMPHNLTSKVERMGHTMAKLRAFQATAQSIGCRHAGYVDRARKLLHSITEKVVRKTLKEGHAPQGDEGLSPEAQKFRWFMTPAEALELLDDAAPVRLSKNTAPQIPDRRRTWPGVSPALTAASVHSRHAVYKRRFGHS